MIKINQVSLRRGSKVLLSAASCIIKPYQRIGLVGKNGAGKTSLFKTILGEFECDQGEIELSADLSIAHIQQEEQSTEIAAINYIVAGDERLATINLQLQQAEVELDGLLISECHQRLYEIDGYTAESRAEKIALGLGFKRSDLKQPVSVFSGGWRMRLNLARVLMSPSDVMLLDEPTNHLDIEAIFWLVKWLTESKQTIVIISHDRDFLDRVVNHVIHIDQQQLHSYTGNYSRFEEQYAMQLEQQQASHEKQQRQIEHLMSFVKRFGAKASKAKQAQSRLKMVSRIEQVAAVHLTNPFSFEFKPAKPAGNPMITLRKADIGYDNVTILHQVTLSIHPGDRIAFLGINGAGKSTLVKALAGKNTVNGEFLTSNKLSIGYFTQHQVDYLSLNQHPLWHLQQIDSKITEQQARQFFGGFNFQNDKVFEHVSNFSGGEKARLALALLLWQQPNLILMDEPTNHLDLDMRQALINALTTFNGALVLISHDRYLLENLIDDYYLIADGEVNKFAGTIEAYQELIINRDKPTPPKISKATKDNLSVKAVNNTLQQQEKKLAKLEQQLQQIDEQLAEKYHQSQEINSSSLFLQREQVAKKIMAVEAKIYELI